MTTAAPLLLITKDPSHPLAHLALRYARACLQQSAAGNDSNHAEDSTLNPSALNVFFMPMPLILPTVYAGSPLTKPT